MRKPFTLALVVAMLAAFGAEAATTNGSVNSVVKPINGGTGTNPYIYSTNHAVLASEYGGLLALNSSTPATFTLPKAGSTGFGASAAFNFSDIGTAALTLSTTGGSNLYGMALTSSSIVLNQYNTASCASNGTDWYCAGNVAAGSSGISTTPIAIAASTSTLTPAFGSATNFFKTLVHADCPCTMANPSGSITPGQTGNFVITQSSTGSDTIGSWGSYYNFPSATPPILSTATGAKDNFSYYVSDNTHIVVKPILANFQATTPSIPLATDGSCSNSGTSSTSSCSITTTASNDIIVVNNVVTPNSGGPYPISGISDTAGLTWNLSTSKGWTDGTGGSATIETWWAKAPSPVTGDTITVSYTASPTVPWRIAAVGVTGANLTTPFDINAGAPAFTSGTASSLTNTISTTNPNTLLLAFLRDTDATALGTVTRPSGFAQILATGSYADFSYKIVSSTQSSATYAFSWSNGSLNNVGYVLNAVQGN